MLDISILGAAAEVARGVQAKVGPSPEDLVGQYLVLELLPPTGVSVSVRLTGEIMNATPGPTGGTRVGLKFLGLTEPESTLLQALELMKALW